MTEFMKHGRKLITVTVDGEEMRARDAMFVIYSPEGEPKDAFASDSTMLDSIPRAARTHWYGDTAAIEALNSGWRIVFMSRRKYLAEVASKMSV